MIAVMFLAPAWWPWLAVLLPAMLLAVSRRGTRREILRRDVLGGTIPPLRRRRRMLTHMAWWGGGLALGLALLRPVAGDEAGEPEGPDVVFCLDVSWSMAARDVHPSRLEHAKAELARVAEASRGARFGLVAFAGEARLLVPLTEDAAAVVAMAGQMAPGAELLGGTDLGAAIEAGAEALRRGGAIAGHLVLLSDGEDFGAKARRAARGARRRGVTTHCIGYGSEVGSKIAVATEEGERFLRDASGREIISVPDREGLAAVADAGGGLFLDGGGDGVLAHLYAGELQPRAEEAALRAGTRRPSPRYRWLLVPVLLLWGLCSRRGEVNR